MPIGKPQRLNLARRRSHAAAPVRRRPRRLPPTLAALLALAACAAEPVAGDGWPLGGWRLGLARPAQAAPSPDGGDGETVSGSYLVGRFALDRGDLKVAAESFGRALAAYPDDVDLQRQLLGLLVAAGDFDRAPAAADALLRLDPNADDAVLLLALDAARQGDMATAAARLDGLGASGLTGTVKPILLAWARFGAGERREAIAALEVPAGRGGGLDKLQAYQRAVMQGLDGAPAVGLDTLRATFGRDLAQAPVRVVRTAAALELRAGRPEDALGLVQKARALNPMEPQLEAVERALRAGGTGLGAVADAGGAMSDAMVEVAEALAEQEGASQALLFGRLATFVRPSNADAWLVVAAVGLRQERPQQALDALARIPEDSPLARQAGFARARALDALGRTDDAVALLRAMGEEEPARADAPQALGDLLRGKERYQEAEQAYTEAVRRLPRIGREDWRLLYARGIAFERTRRWPQAEADLLKALELQPDQPFVLNYLGYSWVDQRLNLERAEVMLRRAVELRPEDGFIVDSLGWAYYRLGDQAQAVDYLERAVELEPGDPVINDHLGDALWRVGRTREARYQWNRSLTLAPEAELAATIKDKLANGLPDAPAAAAPERKG